MRQARTPSCTCLLHMRSAVWKPPAWAHGCMVAWVHAYAMKHSPNTLSHTLDIFAPGSYHGHSAMQVGHLPEHLIK